MPNESIINNQPAELLYRNSADCLLLQSWSFAFSCPCCRTNSIVWQSITIPSSNSLFSFFPHDEIVRELGSESEFTKFLNYRNSVNYFPLVSDRWFFNSVNSDSDNFPTRCNRAGAVAE